LLKCRDEICATCFDSDMDSYTNLLKESQSKFKGFDKNSNMVLRMNSSVGSLGGVIFEYVKMLTHIDIIKFNNMLKIVQDNEQKIFELASAVGYIDAVIAIVYFRAALLYYCTPNLDMDSTFSIKDGFHPALSNPVPNSFSQKRGMLLTGSNASGKSTFLKMTAINAILAQTIHTCAANEYTGGYYRIYSSMSLRDNLDNGESYYIVEIKALKRIMDEAAKTSSTPVLCFVDEVLRGTNTVERIAASAQILDKLSGSGVICFAATHDIELTHLLENKYDNFHFEEEVQNGDVLFSYHLLKGRSHTRNAIKLLEIIGFSDDIISKADDMAKNFLEKGEWDNVC
jgi:DNA mismatch repair ATPase MutS